MSSGTEARFIYHVHDRHGYHALIAADGLVKLGFPFVFAKLVAVGDVPLGVLAEVEALPSILSTSYLRGVLLSMPENNIQFL